MKDVRCVPGVVDRRLIRVVILVVSIFFSYPVYIQGQAGFAQEPMVQWEMASWSPTDPPGNPETQASSGEDWAYDVKVSYSGGQPDGYIFSGYSTFPGYQFPAAPFCLEPYFSQQGCAMAKLFKTDLLGNVLWYKNYGNNGAELRRVIQTSDGGYLGIGRSFEHNSALVLYNPTNSSPGITIHCSPPQTPCRRHMYLVKTDIDGELEWQYIYGLMDDPDTAGDPIEEGEALNAVEMPNGHIRVVGQTPDPTDPHPGGGLIEKAVMMEVDEDGRLQWIKAYGDPGGASTSRAIARNGDDYVMAINQFDSTTHLSLSSHADIVIKKFGNTSNPPPLFEVNLTESAGIHDTAYDVKYNTAGEILVSTIINCLDIFGGCFRTGASGEGTARVYRLNPTSGSKIDDTGNSLGTVKTFDLLVTMAPTPDGGVAVVSTKQTIEPGPTDPPFSNTDAYVAKLTQGLAVDWDTTYNSVTSDPHNQEGDKSQECMYGIALAPDGGYVVSGNNSSNWDDDYVIKFSDADSQTLQASTVNHAEIYYFADDMITAGSGFTVETEGYAEFIAENEIRLTDGFTAKLGSNFEARIGSVSKYEASARAALAALPESASTAEPPVEVDVVAKEALPTTSHLFPNYPNPFNPSTEIRFALPEASHVSLVVYDVTGREVVRLVDGRMEAGTHRVTFDASSLASGLYLYRMVAGTFVQHGKMLLLK